MVTRSVLYVGSGGPGVPPHTHDGSEIEGTADLIHLRVDQLLAGTITGKEITVAGGAAGVIRSDNFASGVDGWAIFGDGSAEFNDVVVRGTIVAGTGSEVDWSYIKNVVIENADITSLEFSKITAGENDASLVIGPAGSISSANYAAGSDGFQILGTGDAEFNNVTVRGAVIAGAGSSIDWGYIDNVSIGSADITDLSFDKITAGSNTASLVIGAAGSISSSNYAPSVSGWIIDGDGNAEFNDVTVRGDIIAGNWDGGDPVDLSGGPDLSATDGFALDASVGSAQFMRSIYLGGTLELFNDSIDGRLVAGAPNAMQTMIAAPGGFGGIWIGRDVVNNVANSGHIQGINDEELQIYAPASGNSVYRGFMSLTSFNDLGFEAGVRIGIHRNTGSNPRIYFIRCLQGQGVFIDEALRIQDGSAANPAIRFTNDPDTGIYRPAAGDAVNITTGGVARASFSQGSGVFYGEGGTTAADEVFRWNGSTKTIAIHDLFPDIGNHEVLRADRGAGTQTTVVGYFSSWEFDPDTGERRKDDIVSLAESPRWNREWFYKIRPVDFRRISTGEREFGFLLDEWKATADDMKYLTTKGDRWGGSPHEVALLAAIVLEVQDHERRIRALESALEAA